MGICIAELCWYSRHLTCYASNLVRIFLVLCKRVFKDLKSDPYFRNLCNCLRPSDLVVAQVQRVFYYLTLGLCHLLSSYCIKILSFILLVTKFMTTPEFLDEVERLTSSSVSDAFMPLSRGSRQTLRPLLR